MNAKRWRWGQSAGLLTERQLQVLRMRADGLSVHEIGAQLYLSEGGVKQHLNAARIRLGANSLLHAIALAYRRGLLPVDEQQERSAA